jgi:hypothetical protein
MSKIKCIAFGRLKFDFFIILYYWDIKETLSFLNGTVYVFSTTVVDPVGQSVQKGINILIPKNH